MTHGTMTCWLTNSAFNMFLVIGKTMYDQDVIEMTVFAWEVSLECSDCVFVH